MTFDRVADVARPQIRNVIRSKWLLSYVLFFLAATEGLVRFSGDDAKTLLSISNVVLFVVPLMTLVYGTIYLYTSREFIELLLAQPLKRRSVFAGLYVGLSVPLAAAFMTGVSLPFILHGIDPAARGALLTMLASGAALTLIFTGIAFCVALRFDDRLTGLGVGLAVWLALALIYDGAMLLIVAMFPGQSMEKALLAASIANPIDMIRIALLLQFDVSALMGYTGAVFTRFFSGAGGMMVIVTAIIAWIGLPLTAGFISFDRKNF
jgi:Cu-processing system permease protein